MKKDRSLPIINAFLLILLLIAIGVILYLWYQNYRANQLNELVNQNGSSAQDQKNNPASSNKISQASKMAAFSYAYPDNWTIEENSEADFAVIRDENKENIITVKIIKRQGSLAELPFDQYASTAASKEIPGYISLQEIKEIKSEDGHTGYKTRWNIKFLGGEQFVSNPITYFEHPLDPAKSIQINLENANHEKDYDDLIASFIFQK